jgi:hypothetical protein
MAHNFYIDVDMSGNRIYGVNEKPVDDTEAAAKGYVDSVADLVVGVVEPIMHPVDFIYVDPSKTIPDSNYATVPYVDEVITVSDVDPVAAPSRDGLMWVTIPTTLLSVQSGRYRRSWQLPT